MDVRADVEAAEEELDAAAERLWKTDYFGGVATWSESRDCYGEGPFYTRAEYNLHEIILIMMAVVTLPVNVYIVYRYFMGPSPHPKFLLRVISKLSVYIHIMAGCVEILMSIIMWFAAKPELWTRIQAGAAIIHVATAFYQMRLVFGIKVLMHAAYFTACIAKLYFSMNLFFHPTCYLRSLALVAVTSIYAWIRIVSVVQEYLGVMRENQYTISTMFALFIVFPTLGPLMNTILFLVVIIYACLLKLCCSHDTWIMMLRENNARAAIHSPYTSIGAKKLFDDLDEHHQGKVQYSRLLQGATRLGDPQLIDKLVSTFGQKSYKEDAGRLIPWEEFERAMCKNGSVTQSIDLARKRSSRTHIDSVKLSPELRARFIFDAVDETRDGAISVKEMAVLLLHYGMPSGDISAIFKSSDENHDAEISFEAFYKYYRPLWEYAFEEVEKSFKESTTDTLAEKGFRSRVKKATSTYQYKHPRRANSYANNKNDDEPAQLLPELSKLSSEPSAGSSQRRLPAINKLKL